MSRVDSGGCSEFEDLLERAIWLAEGEPEVEWEMWREHAKVALARYRTKQRKVYRLVHDTSHAFSRKSIAMALDKGVDLYYAEGDPSWNIGAIVNGVHYVFDADKGWIVLPEVDPNLPHRPYGNARLWDNRFDAESEALRFVNEKRHEEIHA